MKKINWLAVAMASVVVLSACGGGGTIAPTFGDGGTCTDTWASYGQSFFSSNCSGCHSSFRTQSAVKSQVASIRSRVAGGSMPPRGISSTDEQRVVLYLDCGAP